MSKITKTGIVEALIFASPGPVGAKRLMNIASLESTDEADRIVETLNETYEKNGRVFRIKRLAGGYQFFTLTGYAPFVGELFTVSGQPHLTHAMLEALSIIALRQPTTKPVVDKIRGADSSAPIHSLLEAGLITIKGRQKTPGRPFLYATTDEFLKMFGLDSIAELPKEDDLAELFSDELQKAKEDAEKAYPKKNEENEKQLEQHEQSEQ